MRSEGMRKRSETITINSGQLFNFENSVLLLYRLNQLINTKVNIEMWEITVNSECEIIKWWCWKNKLAEWIYGKNEYRVFFLKCRILGWKRSFEVFFGQKTSFWVVFGSKCVISSDFWYKKVIFCHFRRTIFAEPFLQNHPVPFEFKNSFSCQDCPEESLACVWPNYKW